MLVKEDEVSGFYLLSFLLMHYNAPNLIQDSIESNVIE